MATQTMTESMKVAVEPTMHMKLGSALGPQPPPGAKTNNTLRMRNLKLDPARALEPARKKLSTIESQRIMAVFEESIRRAEIVTALPFIMANIDRFRVSLGSELVDLIKQHSRIQSSYKDIRSQLDDLLQKRAAQLAKIEERKAAADAANAIMEEEKVRPTSSLYDDFDLDDEEEEDGEDEDDDEAEDGEYNFASKQGSKGVSKKASKQENKEDTKQGSKEDSKQASNQESKEDTKQGSKEASKQESKEDTKQGSKEDSKQASKQESKEDTKQTSKEDIKPPSKVESQLESQPEEVNEGGLTSDGVPSRKDSSPGEGSGLEKTVSAKEDVAGHVDHMVSEDRFSRQLSAQSVTSVMSDYEPRIEEVMRNLGLVAQQVSHSCKNILRLFTVNPAAMKIITGDGNGSVRDSGGQNIVDNMIELRDILMHKLLTTPEEEKERMDYLDDISKRERHNAAIIEKLEKELKDAIDDKEEEIRKKNEVIKRLQTDLHQIEKFSDENIRRTRAEAEKQEIADAKNSDQKTQKLQSEINQLQTQLNNAIAEHRELEADLRAKKYKVENEVDNWIQKYDQDLGERQDEYEEIDLVYTEEKKQLLELEERFATLEKEYLAIMEERRVARDKRERAQRELAILVKSATTIQAFWRSYKVRKALKAKSKKKGGKKGKK